MQALAFIRPRIVSVIPWGHTFFFRHDTAIQSSVFFPPHWLPNKNQHIAFLYALLFSGHPVSHKHARKNCQSCPSSQKTILVWPSQARPWLSKMTSQGFMRWIPEMYLPIWKLWSLCMYVLHHIWLDEWFWICMRFFEKFNLPKLHPNGFLQFFSLLPDVCFSRTKKKTVPPWEVLQTYRPWQVYPATSLSISAWRNKCKVNSRVKSLGLFFPTSYTNSVEELLFWRLWIEQSWWWKISCFFFFWVLTMKNGP